MMESGAQIDQKCRVKIVLREVDFKKPFGGQVLFRQFPPEGSGPDDFVFSLALVVDDRVQWANHIRSESILGQIEDIHGNQ